ncbi:MAG: conjugative transposon protein TraM, partial [Halanaerobiales bacterium]
SIGVVGTGRARGQTTQPPHGLDMSLPNAKIKDNKGWTKLNYYNEADRDSAKFRAAMQNDPYYLGRLTANNGQGDSFLVNTEGGDNANHFKYDPTRGSLETDPDPNIEKVNQKLAELNKALDNVSTPGIKPIPRQTPGASNNTGISSPDIDRLENMLQAISQNSGGQDPEMQQINGVMDKILDIQHPELEREKIKRESEKNSGQAYPVTVGGGGNDITLLAANQVSSTDQDTIQIKGRALLTEDHNGFYSLEDNPPAIDEQNTIEAVVDQAQTLESGSTVKLRLTDDIYIGGILVPKSNFVYGVAQLNGERLIVTIHSIRYLDNILQVALSAFDLDGLEGIDVPGTITREG